MAKKTLTTNKVLFDTIRDLKKLSNKTGVNVWKAVAEKLSAPASQRPQVNISRINKFANEGEVVIVPGKLLGDGQITKKVTVVAFKASESAIKKLEAAGGKFIEIRNYISKKPDSKVKILG
jgi:large subunit ribosomal protein L18e